jgi:hypothetical protein
MNVDNRLHMVKQAVRLLAVLALTAVPAPGQQWTPPRTPWGDPDIQGDYTNKYEQGTPFERPAEFEGRRVEDVAGDELAALVQQRAVELLLNAPFTGGDPIAGNFGGAPAFYDRFEADRGSRPWFVVDPPDGRVPPLTTSGQAVAATRAAAAAEQRRRGTESYTDRSLYDRCITRGLPGSMMPANYGNSYRIVQGPGYVAISYEMVHETRIIPLAPRPQMGVAIRQYMGEARGRWEGDTLVVETTNFKDEPVYRGSNPSTLRLVERFTATGPDTIEWSASFDDPATWARPWTFAMPLTRNTQEAIFEYACHEGNRAMANLLTAALAEDAAGAAGAGAPSPEAAAPPTVAEPADDGSPTGTARSALSGTWVADSAGGRGNFAGFSTPTRLAISESDVAVTVDTDTGTERQMQRVVYRLDGTATNVPGPIGWETTATATRQDDRLIVTITRIIQGPETPLRFEVIDRYSADGDGLTIERSQGARSRTMTFRRAR